LLRRVRNTQFSHPEIQRESLDSELDRCSSGTCHYPFRLLQSLADMRSLGIVQRELDGSPF